MASSIYLQALLALCLSKNKFAYMNFVLKTGKGVALPLYSNYPLTLLIPFHLKCLKLSTLKEVKLLNYPLQTKQR